MFIAHTTTSYKGEEGSSMKKAVADFVGLVSDLDFLGKFLATDTEL
jgi:hypothetical protein